MKGRRLKNQTFLKITKYQKLSNIEKHSELFIDQFRPDFNYELQDFFTENNFHKILRNYKILGSHLH